MTGNLECLQSRVIGNFPSRTAQSIGRFDSHGNETTLNPAEGVD
jgi:hypothetical protein